MKKWGLMLAASMAVLPLAGCGAPGGAPGTAPDAAGGEAETGTSIENSRLKTVLDRGSLVCGVDGAIPGFSFVEDGKYSGLDVDVCKAVAAALFDDPEAVEYRNLNSTERFEALKAGEVDMLSRNTTWTINRDTALGLEFAPTTFFDSQGMMVRSAENITDLKGLEGKSVCVEAGTTTELNLTDAMREEGVTFEPVVFQDADAAYGAYDEARCDAMTSDKSQLAARRSTLKTPGDHVLLDVTMSKEPLGPVTMNNDSAWFDTIKWVTYALIQAEEFGLTADTVEAATTSKDPNILRFVGAEGTLGTDMGLPNDFALRAVKHVGNYGEIYERNLGEATELKLARGQNALWTEGGLMYAPPFR
jgi:general L-amino acid transport system substrate-binding protein